MQVPLAEHFHSIQGEGRWVGTPMHFLRFPGCNVGRVQRAHESPFKMLDAKTPAKVCTSFLGEEFYCDTDYGAHEHLEVAELVRETWEDVVCFTGGEPLMHQRQTWYKELFRALQMRGCEIHVETSGTILPTLAYNWITVAPKYEWEPEAVRQANQIKLLIEAPLTEAKELAMLEFADLASTGAELYVSPVFDPHSLVQANLNAALDFLQGRPDWKLSVQWHKFLGLR